MYTECSAGSTRRQNIRCCLHAAQTTNNHIYYKQVFAGCQFVDAGILLVLSADFADLEWIERGLSYSANPC